MISLFDTLRNKKKQYDIASCLLLTGESGSGKTELAKYYLKKNPTVEFDDRTHIPVLHFELKSISTPLEFLRLLLIAVGDPQQGLGARNQSELYARLVTLIKVTGIELLILDEIQVIIERRSAKVVTGIADLFKDLIKDTKIPIVFMGMPWSKYLVDSNQQLKRRIAYRYMIPPYRISQKTFSDDYRRLLKMLANAYGFTGVMELHEFSIALRFFSATNGNLSSTVNLIRDASIMSKEEDKARDQSLFSDVITSYGIEDEFNAFILPLEKLELRELIIHSDWHFGYKANKNSIIDAEYATYGVTTNRKIYTIDGVA
ncbi:bacterial TniB family protein [Elysia marginata]|uniref:Bacterial TniB family protein n=1 Tax=Elysia marginata TaxID=1093978 RepID=A0AAV4EZ67_9GAST|nr:bacterial TniB family protein [Elysia marginata]